MFTKESRTEAGWAVDDSIRKLGRAAGDPPDEMHDPDAPSE